MFTCLALAALGVSSAGASVRVTLQPSIGGPAPGSCCASAPGRRPAPRSPGSGRRWCSEPGAAARARPTGRIYTLRWAAAIDPVTPSSAIVYDIFFAASAGAENFASPTWTTAPAATGYSGKPATARPACFFACARD